VARFTRGPGVHLFIGTSKRAHGIKWVFIQKLSRDHALELTALVIAGHSPPLTTDIINPLNAELNLICHLLALSGTHHIFHVSGLRVKVQKFAATVPTGIELQRLVLRYGDKFTFASG
jgi:hypothetical protein